MTVSAENNIRVVIADDEPLARQLLVNLVGGQQGLDIVGTAKDGEAARRLIDETEPDLVFLDVEMPKMSGVDLTASLRSRTLRPYVVFVTAHDRYATAAFDLDAVDYLVKPIQKERLSHSVEKARLAIRAARVRRLGEEIVAVAATEPTSGTQRRNRYLVIRQRDELVRLHENDIQWLEAASQYVRIHTDSAKYIVAESLNRYHARLCPETFVRVHRSVVVNTLKVMRVLRRANGVHELQLANGTYVPLSRSRRALVDRFLGVCADNRAGSTQQ
jgi:DNA-binding LytR/AlgR family response regulator